MFTICLRVYFAFAIYSAYSNSISQYLLFQLYYLGHFTQNSERRKSSRKIEKNRKTEKTTTKTFGLVLVTLLILSLHCVLEELAATQQHFPYDNINLQQSFPKHLLRSFSVCLCSASLRTDIFFLHLNEQIIRFVYHFVVITKKKWREKLTKCFKLKLSTILIRCFSYFHFQTICLHNLNYLYLQRTNKMVCLFLFRFYFVVIFFTLDFVSLNVLIFL